MFDCGQKGSANLMRTLWEKLVQYVRTTYSQDISNELQNKVRVTISEPTYSQEIVERNEVQALMLREAHGSSRDQHVPVKRQRT